MITTTDALVIVVLAALYFAGAAVLWRMRARRRRWRPRRPDPELLEQPVVVPPGHPEHWPELDAQDAALAELHDLLWPREEWLFIVECPTPDLTGYATPAEAHAHEPGGTTYDCPCGLLHARHRRARRRGRGGRRHRPSRTASSP